MALARGASAGFGANEVTMLHAPTKTSSGDEVEQASGVRPGHPVRPSITDTLGAAPRSGGGADDQLGLEDDADADGLAGQLGEQQPGHLAAHLLDGLAHGGELRLGVAGDDRVVEA